MAFYFNWNEISSMPRITTCNTYMRSFQYKIFNNIFFLNKTLYLCRITQMDHFNIYFMNAAQSILEQIVHVFSKRIDTSLIKATDCHIWNKRLIYSR